MKTFIFRSRLLAAAGAFSLFAVGHSLAGDAGQTTTAQPLILSGPQTETTTTVTTTAAVSADTAPVRLPYGVDEILKLSRAHIGEEIIVNYIHNTGTAYNLSPNDIVYLKSQDVSDRVVNAMLDERRRVAAEAAAQVAAQNGAPVMDSSGLSASAHAPAYAPSYGYDQAPPADVQSAPSTVYTIPSDQSAYAYYGYPYYYGGYPYSYPYYYGGYYGYGPVINFGFGFGGHYHGGGGFRGGGGGFHGGGIRAGGGFHGGGGHR